MGQTVDTSDTNMPDTPSGRRIIGLTGGIASGKSTVSDYLASQHGLPVLDADVYAREAVEKGSEILSAIAHRYGPSILLSDGHLNRPALGRIIFNNTAEKQWVEAQIHPFVRSQFATTTATYSTEATLIYAVPLLFEANLVHLVTETWVVFCTTTQQRQRLIKRNHLTPEQAQVRIDAQLPLSKKCKQADHVLDNSKSREILFQQVDTLLSMTRH